MRKVTSYYRPPWICGRHDITSSSAIIYNVIAGVNFFFEEFSATVAGFILNTPKSAPIDIFAISDRTGIDIDSLNPFLDELSRHGIVSESPITGRILEDYRSQTFADRYSNNVTGRPDKSPDFYLNAAEIGAAAFPGGLTGRNFMGGFIIFLLCIAGYIYGWYSIESGLLESDGITYMRYILGSGIIAFILAVTVGIYTASNMDDVVSYRMLYQNSNVEMFDMTLLYTLNRFMAAFVYFSWTAVFSISYLFLKSNI